MQHRESQFRGWGRRLPAPRYPASKDQPESPYKFSSSAFGQWHRDDSYLVNEDCLSVLDLDLLIDRCTAGRLYADRILAYRQHQLLRRIIELARVAIELFIDVDRRVLSGTGVRRPPNGPFSGGSGFSASASLVVLPAFRSTVVLNFKAWIHELHLVLSSGKRVLAGDAEIARWATYLPSTKTPALPG